MSEVLGESPWSEGLTSQINSWGGEINADKWNQVAEDKKTEIIQTAKEVNEFIIWLRGQHPSNPEIEDVISEKIKNKFSDLGNALLKHTEENPSLHALHSFVGNMISNYMYYIIYPEKTKKNTCEEQLDFAQSQINFIIAQEINLQ
jgi:hypothetical protein